MTRESREDIARREVGHTDISPRTSRTLVVGFLAVLLLVPAVQFVIDVRHDKTPKIFGITQLFADGNGRPQVPSPAAIAAFEDTVTANDWVRDSMLGPLQNLLVGLGAGNTKTWIGRDGYLFFEPGVSHITGAGYLHPRVQKNKERMGLNADPKAAILHFHQQLDARGIQLILAPIPVKASVYPEFLTTSANPLIGLTHPDDPVLFSALREAGVVVVDLLPNLLAVKHSESAFLKTDTHWTPAGMSAAAKRLAQATGMPKGSPSWRLETQEVTTFGDLSVMLKLPEGQTRFPMETVRTQRLMTNKGEPWLPNRQADVLLLGDSFTNIYTMPGLNWGEHAGLAEHLAYNLGRDVDRIAINDSGSFSTREALARALARGEDRLAGKKVVIWAFSARELSHGDWRLIDLPEVTAPKPRQSVVDSEPIIKEGVITAATRAPAPGTAPYRDAVIALSLDDECVAYLWGLRDNKTMPGNAYRVGDRVKVTLRPWSQAATTYGGYQRLELSGAQFFSMPVFWAMDHRLITLETEEKAGDPKTIPEEPTTPVPPRTIAGKDGWLFFGPEWTHLQQPAWWTSDQPEDRNPLSAIKDFQAQLVTIGAELLVVPVPAKARLYPQHLPDDRLLPDDDQDQTFLKALDDAGIPILDIGRLFQEDGGSDLYLKTDTHWSPKGIALTAEALAERMKQKSWYLETAKKTYQTKERDIDIKGDLAGDTTTESVTISRVRDGKGRRAKAPKPDRNSPVLLMGDSHTLVFHAGGDLFARGAGLPDQLALHLGFPVDLVGVRGSGATATRLDLMRRDDNLKGKKQVIWVFSVREFTQGARDWSKVPVID